MANADDLLGRLPVAGPTRAANRRKVLLAVAIKSGTQADIAHRTLLSQATVSAAVRELAEAKTSCPPPKSAARSASQV